MAAKNGLLQFRIIGYGYMQIDEHGRLKWGWSTNPTVRRNQCQTGNGDRLRLLLLVPGITQADERRFHGEIRNHRVAPHDPNRREWYFNRPQIWSALKKFVKAHRTTIVMIEPEQGYLFDGGDFNEDRKAG